MDGSHPDKSAPPRLSLSATSSPPCRRMMRSNIAIPRPLPPVERFRDISPLNKGSNTRFSSFSANPEPVSRIVYLTWSVMLDLRVSKPMKLQLHFEVIVQRDVMTGTAKAGFLPASKLTGHRLV